MRRLAVLLPAFFACAGDPPPPAPALPPVLPPDPQALHVGGSGALRPLMTRLAAAHGRAGAGLRIMVEESIGSGGGVRAAWDGALDLGLVSRPLSDDERRLGLAVVPMGRDVVALAAHPDVPVDSISAKELAALYHGARRTFADGSPAVVLLRDRGESANGALEEVVPGLAAAREAAYRRHTLRVLYHDSAMAEALATTPGAVGVFPLGAAITFRLPLKILALDGLMPSPEAVRQGRWRASRELFVVARPDRLPRAGPFLRFVASDAGRRIAVECGYLPP